MASKEDYITKYYDTNRVKINSMASTNEQVNKLKTLLDNYENGN